MIKFRHKACKEALPIILGVIVLTCGMIAVNGWNERQKFVTWQVTDNLNVLGYYDD